MLANGASPVYPDTNNDFDAAPLLGQLNCQFTAIHPRHNDISEQQVNAFGVLGSDLQSMSAIFRSQDGIASTLQHPLRELTHFCLILNDEHRLRSPRSGAGV